MSIVFFVPIIIDRIETLKDATENIVKRLENAMKTNIDAANDQIEDNSHIYAKRDSAKVFSAVLMFIPVKHQVPELSLHATQFLAVTHIPNSVYSSLNVISIYKLTPKLYKLKSKLYKLTPKLYKLKPRLYKLKPQLVEATVNNDSLLRTPGLARGGGLLDAEDPVCVAVVGDVPVLAVVRPLLETHLRLLLVAVHVWVSWLACLGPLLSATMNKIP